MYYSIFIKWCESQGRLIIQYLNLIFAEWESEVTVQ